MPSPKIGFFDGVKSSPRTPNGHKLTQPGLRTVTQKWSCCQQQFSSIQRYCWNKLQHISGFKEKTFQHIGGFIFQDINLGHPAVAHPVHRRAVELVFRSKPCPNKHPRARSRPSTTTGSCSAPCRTSWRSPFRGFGTSTPTFVCMTSAPGSILPASLRRNCRSRRTTSPTAARSRRTSRRFDRRRVGLVCSTFAHNLPRSLIRIGGDASICCSRAREFP
ncbi:uncharacterized protein LOC127239599 isoform X2 [Andrographis paniculata]|uniref:uncharacterized protein LOC127239599 isoform X1 n=1 Tax=Andrographis paniculata TaxID=175694 RepID=UPI0021E8B29F|nr:uncharacterized protein LOC127239599 isoform X1 [Andrographis paniculata]XP_051113780.1 uncharacterized protein LOC127239599 isoform X1 [Andrographis paniculata]XP_051113781.1 uncharacterized protein LOC127239599 isoform X2 [Andrographis paniculata]XP_051113782.1 uncharacterized protein LOC127239599 isoform X1 [Andrographis paniculata]XP_051113783.1 uncharacterized protein LOC127239599 isoform X1 [Andrographis paniculata]XP_051113784.1 uncharacterized protein LOC127239599 isoform X1 [Androg